MDTNHVTRDDFGMYAANGSGPGPAPMGANTLLGNDVYSNDGLAVFTRSMALRTLNSDGRGQPLASPEHSLQLKEKT